VRVGLIGPGYWGTKVLRNLEVHPLVEDITVADKENGYGHLLADSGLTHVFVTTPVVTHYDICHELIRNGKHVMCEKNLVPTYYQTEMLHLHAAYAGVKLFVDFIFSFNPVLITIAEDLKNNPLSRGADIKVNMLQHGVFRGEHVMSMLGSHALAILGTVTDIGDLRLAYRRYGTLSEEDKAMHVGYVTPEGVILRVNVSLLADEKERTIEVSGRPVVNLDHPDGIRHMIDLFLNGGNNIQLALDVASCLEQAK